MRLAFTVLRLKRFPRPTAWFGALMGGFLCSAALLFAPGCPSGTSPPDGGGGGDDAPVGDATGKIVNIPLNVGLSELSAPISVIYDFSGTVDLLAGFFVPVDDSAPGAAEIGVRVIIAPNLPVGDNQAFNFDPSVAGLGFYRVGILWQVAGTESAAQSAGIIQVQGSPSPEFIRPIAEVTDLAQGAELQILFDVGDPEADAQWRLFFLSSTDSLNLPAHQLGTLIKVGSGNLCADCQFSSVGLLPGTYELGLSATDSGLSVDQTSTTGDPSQIVTIPNATDRGPLIRVTSSGVSGAPSLAFSAPGASDVELFADEPFSIQFTVSIFEAGAQAVVELFYDDDNIITNGFRALLPGATDLPVSTTSYALPTDFLPEGKWFIGGTVRTTVGESPPITAYAQGTITIVREPTLNIDEPNSTLPVAPGSDVNIRWSTNAPSDTGTVDVFATSLDGTNTVTDILVGAPISTRSAVFSSSVSGLFQITVRLTFDNPNVTDLEGVAPEDIRVSSLPAVIWVGSLAQADPPIEGAIFGGVNNEDNTGTSFASAGDINGDGFEDFIINARYGKPFFVNPTGVGPGEAYLIFGGGGLAKPLGEFNLNSVGTAGLTGVVFAGVRTPQTSNDTDGISSVFSIPDVDGDGRPELVFGFPNTDSRGHNISLLQDGVRDPRSLATLEREEQFLRGGIVMVSSLNSALQNPTVGNQVIMLDMVGQDFLMTCVEVEPNAAADAGDFATDIHSDETSDPPCDGTCVDPQGGGVLDSSDYLNYGFVSALARDYFWTYIYSSELSGGLRVCGASADVFRDNPCLDLNSPVFNVFCAGSTSTCEPFSPGLHAAMSQTMELALRSSLGLSDVLAPLSSKHSGFYVSEFAPDPDNADDLIANEALEPLGARIIGMGLGDGFGTSLTLSQAPGSSIGQLIVSAPGRTARGILMGPSPGGCNDPPSCGGEINGLESSPGAAKTNTDSGVAYLFSLRSLWTPDLFGRNAPKPHQYIVGASSHSCSARGIGIIDNIDAIRIAGLPSDKITNILGIDDYNGDGRDDFAIGAPLANGGQGRVYIAFRRDPLIEGDYVLEKLAVAPTDPNRLDGLLIVSSAVAGLGSSLATGFDFNGDGISDLAIGSPDAAGGVGEVIIVFGGLGVGSGVDGISVNTLLTQTRTADFRPVAARIIGNPLDQTGRFGFNLINAGDLDGDGRDDLLVAAPNATPRFDPVPTDSVDELIEKGLDLDFDGQQDDVSGPLRRADGVVDQFDDLQNAGLVYVIFGSNRLDLVRTCSQTGNACATETDCPAGEFCVTPNDITLSINQLGTSQLRGFMLVGREAGDRLGGGDAGDVGLGGISAKTGRGRSFGLGRAGDVDGDGRDDILVGSILADPRRDPNTGVGVQNGGEAYLIYGSVARP